MLTLAPAVIATLVSGSIPSIKDQGSLSNDFDEAGVNCCDERTICFKTEAVPDGTVCYVDVQSAQALEKVGWPILKEDGESGTRYYYVTNLGIPKIADVSIAATDRGQLISRISRIQGDVVAKNILITPDINPANINNTVLGYLRSFNKNYVGGYDQLWDVVAHRDEEDVVAKELTSEVVGSAFMFMGGRVDPAYAKVQDMVFYKKEPIYHYFCPFVSSRNWSDTYHYSYPNNFNGEEQLLPDPVPGHDGAWGVDAIHMFAALDGGYNLTRQDTFNVLTSRGLDLLYPTLEQSRQLTSWAGDLQQAVVETDDRDYRYGTTCESVLFSHGAGRGDLLADVDAINVESKYLTSVGFLSDALNDYYDETLNNEIRFTKFMENLGGGKTGFEAKVYDYLGLVKANGILQNSEEYQNHIPFTNPKFAMMDVANLTGKGASRSKRSLIANTFISFVESRGTAQ